jgi:hypothetical protein
MSFLKKLFGKKESNGVSDLKELGLEVEVTWGDDGEELSADGYCHNHCFIFYGLNEEAFSNIENEVQNYDGPDALSLLRSMEGVLMAPLNEQSAGTDKISSIVDSDDDLIAYVEERLDKYLELIANNFDSAIGRECIDLINIEKPSIADAIFAATKTWAKSDKFEHENFIGAMIVFVKSSKSFDRQDSISEQPNGMNLPVVTRNGFVRSCIYSCEDVINVKYDSIWDVTDWLDDPRGCNPKNSGNYGREFMASGAPFGFTYFDQDGQLWSLQDVGKAITLLHEDETGEDVDQHCAFEVSH